MNNFKIQQFQTSGRPLLIILTTSHMDEVGMDITGIDYFR